MLHATRYFWLDDFGEVRRIADHSPAHGAYYVRIVRRTLKPKFDLASLPTALF